MDKNTIVKMTFGDFKRYITYREKKAQLQLVEDHIKPYNREKAERLVKKIKAGGNTCDVKKVKHTPKELVVRILNQQSEEDYSEMTQFLVRE